MYDREGGVRVQRNFVDTQDFTKEEILDMKDLGIKIKKYLKACTSS